MAETEELIIAVKELLVKLEAFDDANLQDEPKAYEDYKAAVVRVKIALLNQSGVFNDNSFS